MQGRLENEIKINNIIENNLKKLPDYIKEWHNYLKASHKTAATRRDYIYKIRVFLTYINKNPKDVTPELFTYDIIAEYFSFIQTKENKFGELVYTSDSYQQTIWCCLNNFMDFMVNRKYIEKNYVKEIEKPKNRDLDRINEHRRALTKEEVKQIINSIKESGDKNCERDLAVFSLFMNTGMRREALIEINLSDIDNEEHIIHVIDKGQKLHSYPINDTTWNYINCWINKREWYPNSDVSEALFINKQGNRISGTSIYNLIDKRVYDAIGIHYKPHGCRGSFATIVYEETGDAEFTRRAVGHSNIATTQRYISTNNMERQKASQIMQDIM